MSGGAVAAKRGRSPSRRRSGGEAVAIIDLDPDGSSLPRAAQRSRTRARLAAAGAGLAIGLAVGLAPLALAPRSAAAPPTVPASSTGAPASLAGNAAASRPLVLPAGVIDAELFVMPDRYVNEPLPASFRLVVSVRGIPAVATVEPPAQITWTEGGLSYRLTSRGRSVAQLVDIAGALR